MSNGPNPDYGIDAPGLLRGFVVVGSILVAIAVALLEFAPGKWALLAIPAFFVAGHGMAMGGLMLWSSRVGKVRGREAILDLHAWRGDEQVLDIGCGRGLMLIGAALRLTTGHATGIDIWLDRDQAANSADAARSNARAGGVADRVTIATADMRDLPFATGSFDAIFSHWVVHNVSSRNDRAVAMGEMARVIKPGGTIALTDITNRQEYLAAFRDMGMQDVRLVVASPALDILYGALSFGSYRPATVVGRAPMA